MEGNGMSRGKKSREAKRHRERVMLCRKALKRGEERTERRIEDDRKEESKKSVKGRNVKEVNKGYKRIGLGERRGDRKEDEIKAEESNTKGRRKMRLK